jgi:myo-inositol-1(or 4)-monophosphatase
MADVAFAFVYDFGPGEEWRAERGGGAFLDDVRIDDPPGERRKRDGRLELLALEQTDPRHLARVVEPLGHHAARIRALGSMAVALCQVAATRVDAMASLWRTRAVDVAAAQLVVRESGGVVAFGGCTEPLGAPLDLEPRAPVVAARTQATLDALMEIVA